VNSSHSFPPMCKNGAADAATQARQVPLTKLPEKQTPLCTEAGSECRHFTQTCISSGILQFALLIAFRCALHRY
jgi:hypothetical protein